VKKTDKITKQQRSYVMSRIRGTRTKPELEIKSMLDGRKLRYQPKGIPERPDFASKKLKLAVFIDGCFWHGCPTCYREPKSNKKFWREKIERNRNRDKTVNRSLRKNGWKVIRFWEHDVRKNRTRVAERIHRAIE
tara:strand:+ start:1079 stop:1483 length:405 start_codon:yes stop_codon:yes gene_type:complete